MKRIAVILVDWNGVEVTQHCLQSLQQAQLSAGFEWKVYLVDNGSTIPLTTAMDPSVLVVNGAAVTMIRSEQNLGFTGGNNLGVEQALVDDPDYIFFLNNDTEVSPDFLGPLLECLDSDPAIVAVQPQICFYPEKERIWNAGNLFFPLIGHTQVQGYGTFYKETTSTTKEQRWLTGCAILAKASLFKAPFLLRFNDRFFALYEDVDLSFRIRMLGGRLCYVSQSRIFHRAGYSSNTREKGKEGFTHPFMVFLNSRNRIWIARLHTPWYFMPTTFLFLTGYFLLLIPYFLVRGRTQKAFLVIKAIKAGIFESPV